MSWLPHLGLLLLFALLVLALLYLLRAPRRRPPSKPLPRVQALDASIYVESLGQGPPLVLLHGIGASGFTWRLVTKALSSDFQVINVDLPGFGQSSKKPDADYGLDAQAERLLTLLQELKVNQAFLMGSSMGGALALWLSKQDPQKFPRVMALAPATDPSRVWVNWQSVKWLLPLAPRLYSNTLLRQIYRRTVTSPSLLHEETYQGYEKPFRDPSSVLTFVKATSLLRDSRLPKDLAQVQSEVALLYGEKDQMVRKKEILKLSSVLPRAQLFLHPSAGHHIQEDHPDWVIERAREFFLRKAPKN